MCMYVYVHECVLVWYVYVCVHVSLCVCVFVFICAYVSVCICVCMCVCMFMCVYVCSCGVYIYMWACAFVCMFVCVCMGSCVRMCVRYMWMHGRGLCALTHTQYMCKAQRRMLTVFLYCSQSCFLRPSLLLKLEAVQSVLKRPSCPTRVSACFCRCQSWSSRQVLIHLP